MENQKRRNHFLLQIYGKPRQTLACPCFCITDSSSSSFAPNSSLINIKDTWPVNLVTELRDLPGFFLRACPRSSAETQNWAAILRKLVQDANLGSESETEHSIFAAVCENGDYDLFLSPAKASDGSVMKDWLYCAFRKSEFQIPAERVTFSFLRNSIRVEGPSSAACSSSAFAAAAQYGGEVAGFGSRKRKRSM